MTTTTKRSTLLLACLIILSTALAACGPAAGGNKPVEVQVTLTDFAVQTSLSTFSVGVPYHFVIVNKGSVAHEFIIMPPAADTATADEKRKSALLTVGESDLQSGATKAVDFTFTAAAPAGTLEIACHIAGHYEAGMHLPIVVK
jgi:uncharacterized cupredoxin-like copper-binding protein